MEQSRNPCLACSASRGFETFRSTGSGRMINPDAWQHATEHCRMLQCTILDCSKLLAHFCYYSILKLLYGMLEYVIVDCRIL